METACQTDLIRQYFPQVRMERKREIMRDADAACPSVDLAQLN